MCGFVGFVHNDRTYPVDPKVLLDMRDCLTHRGPDDCGHFVEPGIGLGSRRLSILDLSEHGRMPMSTTDGRYHIIYNGEVYNFQALRSSLEKKGVRFQSNTDTEVLLQLFATEGPGMLGRLNGMFAFAVWDSQERTLFLVRDRLGIKPLYYANHGEALFFGSEEKSLFVAGVPAEFDVGTWEELLCFKFVAGDRTPFLGVKRLLPGHYAIWKDGKLDVRRWWTLRERVGEIRGERTSNPEKWFEETFDDAVSLRRISDVPVGVMLSGGLDSSSIAASLSRHDAEGMASFTVRFKEDGYDEGILAREVAERARFGFNEIFVHEDQLLSRLVEATWFNDEPLVHSSSLHILSLAEYAKPRVTVLLSGEGSDEVLGGYVRYRPLSYAKLLRAMSIVLAPVGGRLKATRRLSKLRRYGSVQGSERLVLYNACDIYPTELSGLGRFPEGQFQFRELILHEALSLYPTDPVRQAMYVDQHTFLCSLLDRNDRMTMGASIECRVPFLDYRIVEGVAALPSSVILGRTKNKQLLRRSIGSRLPASVLRGRKWGFGVPWNSYLRQVSDLVRVVKSLPGHPLIRGGPLHPGQIQTMVDEFLLGDDRHAALTYQLAMLVIWYDTYFDRLSRLPKRQHAST
jgi:asparagine synthase (glutamine-hydrolysing)